MKRFDSRPVVRTGRQQPKTTRSARLKQLQDRRVELTRNACETATANSQPTLEFRLASIDIQDPVAWLRWMYPSGLPQQLHGWIERLEAGDDYLTSVVLQTRTEMGL